MIKKLSNTIIGLFFFFIILTISSLVWYNVYNEGFVKLEQDGIIEATTLENINKMNNVYSFIDKLVPLIFIMLWGLVMYSSFYTSPEHPVMFIISFFSLAFTTFITFLLVDLGSTILDNTVFSPIVNIISNTAFFINNYHFISFFVMLFSLVWWFRKTSGFMSNAGFGGIE